jgi:protein lifeguard
MVLQAAILTATAVIGLTLFTFWAVKRGFDFKMMFPFLFTSLITLLVYITIQVCIPALQHHLNFDRCVSDLRCN